MILSVSRRTDIPAFYSQWFFNRLEEGRIYVRNPVNPRQVTALEFEKDQLDGIVFWTKNPKPMLHRLDELEGIPYYFQFTLTPYGQRYEPGASSLENRIETLLALAEKVGPDRVIWRYDPIILDHRMNADWHRLKFEMLAEKFRDRVKRVVISYVQGYKNTRKNMIVPMVDDQAKQALAKSFQNIASSRGMVVQGCCEPQLKEAGIPSSNCVDAALLSKIAGHHIDSKPATGQREGCDCDQSVDIGAYNSCPHKCKYCYANYNETLIDRNVKQHNPEGLLLYGEISERDRVHIKRGVDKPSTQIRLIDL